MGMGYAANVVDTISDEGLDAICPVEYRAFMAVLEKHALTMPSWAKDSVENDLYDRAENLTLDDEFETRKQVAEIVGEIDSAFVALQNAFKKATTVGDQYLELSCGYHDSESNGDRYDDITGGYWEIEHAWVKSKPHEKFKQYINRLGFVTFG